MTQNTRILSVANLGIGRVSGRRSRCRDAMVAARQRDEAIGDTLLLLEHPHVFTLGRGADERFLLAHRRRRPGLSRIARRPGDLSRTRPAHRLSDSETGRTRSRRASILAQPRGSDDRALADCGIEATRREGLTGIWVGARKIGSIGVGIKRWTTCHGFALNVCPDLSYFMRHRSVRHRRMRDDIDRSAARRRSASMNSRAMMRSRFARSFRAIRLRRPSIRRRCGN